jgi:hypothetical protein
MPVLWTRLVRHFPIHPDRITPVIAILSAADRSGINLKSMKKREPSALHGPAKDGAPV